jgi:hypothetical protein
MATLPSSESPPPASQPTLVLDRVLRVLRPLVRLLLRNGVTYTVLVAALKRVFLDAAREELQSRGMATTDSAITLLCGVHRRDVRTLSRGETAPAATDAASATGATDASGPVMLPLGLAAQVVARWINDPAFVDAQGAPRVLPRSAEGGNFDALVLGVSSDVRPRAVLDELLRLGVAHETPEGVALEGSGFAPRQGFDELSQLFAANLHDHAAAAVANLQGEASFLEQAVFVDEITAESAQRLHQASVLAWKQALKTVMHEAQARFDSDATQADATTRTHRARFGVYFYSEREDPLP